MHLRNSNEGHLGALLLLKSFESSPKVPFPHWANLYSSRKSDCSKNTLDDIWDVLLWELQALQDGKLPLQAEFGKPPACQAAGAELFPQRSKPLHVCLVQIRGDWAWFAEALGVWQWNCKAFMCNLSMRNCYGIAALQSNDV